MALALLDITTGLTGTGLHTWAGANFDIWTWQIELFPSWAAFRLVGTDRQVIWGAGIQRAGLVSGSIALTSQHSPIQLEHRIGGTEPKVVQPFYPPAKWSSVAFNISPGFQLTLALWTL